MGQTVQFRILIFEYSSVTLNELAMKARERIFNKTAYKKTNINPNVVQILKTCLEYMGLNIYKFLISQKVCINDDPGVTMTYFTARSYFVVYVF